MTTIPDNNVRTLKYLDPTTGSNTTCQTCPLSTDSSILYQDFLFDQPVSITGVQIKLNSYTGSGPGLHILQLLSSGAFASSISDNNHQSCFAPNPSNTTQTGQWSAKVANTNIAGTVQTVLVSSVAVGTPPSSGPTFTWIPYVSAAGNYDINLLIPGCTNFQDCASRTSVKVTVFPGAELPPYVADISQQNADDASVLLYSGPILPSTPSFVTTITMALSDSPTGSGQAGTYELVADRIQLVLKSANVNATSTQSGSGGVTQAAGLTRAFGFLEWPRGARASGIDGRSAFPNSTFTSLDIIGVNILNGIGGVGALSSPNMIVNAVAQHSTGIFVAGSFSLTSGSASGSSNIVAFKNGALAGVAEGGLNGEVSSMVLSGNQLFVGGSFKDTRSGSTKGALSGIALYDVEKNVWSTLGAGVDGAVSSLGTANNQIQVAGNFTKVLSSASGNSGVDAPGFATWDIKSGSWVNSGGFVLGKMTFVDNQASSTSYMAGSISAFRKYGASGLVMLKNGDANGPGVSPLAVGLGASVGSSSSGLQRRRPSPLPFITSWASHLKVTHLLTRQTSGQQAPLSAALPATAPAVLAGAFWLNSSTSKEVVIFGGNFSFIAPGASAPSIAVAIYDPESHGIQGLTGSQIQGVVRALLVDGNLLWVGGEFTIQGASLSGLAVYDLSKKTWDLNGLQSLQANSGSTVVVRSITKSSSKPNLIIVAGSFAQAGSLRCQSICSFDTQAKQWVTLSNGIQGEVASVAYAGVCISFLILDCFILNLLLDSLTRNY